jgi:hypothetical protein
MTRSTYFLKMLFSLFIFSLLNAGIIHAAHGTPQQIHGKVTEIIDVSGYTYVEVDTGTEKIWAAGPPTPLTKGDMISFSAEMPMQDFQSKSIDRIFPVIYFVNRYNTETETPATTKTHPQIAKPLKEKPVTGIDKLEDGNTIAEIYSDKINLKDKTVRVRGEVTKFTAGIMGKNWIHIRDSSTLDDLTITTDATAVLGEVVIGEGKLELDKDYGYGYLYPVILENARITK